MTASPDKSIPEVVVDELIADWIENGQPHADHQPPVVGKGQSQTDGLLNLRSYARIRPEPVEWIWEPRIPRGTPTLLVGQPGLGKTLLAVWIAARVTRGEFGAGPAHVLYCTGEDSPEHTLSPRLHAAGAALERIHDVRLTRDGIAGGISIPEDVDKLAEAIESTSAALLVIDPLMAHLSSDTDSHRDHSIRRALAPIYHLCTDSGCTALVIGHLNKAPSRDLFTRVGGSIGLTAAARSILLLTRAPDSDEGSAERVLTHGKSNVAELAPALRLRVESVLVAPGPISTACVRIGEEAPHLHTFDVLQDTRDEQPARNEAKAFLRDALALGPRSVKDVQREARSLGISDKTLRRAREDLGIRSEKPTFKGGWTWELPEDAQGMRAPSKVPTAEGPVGILGRGAPSRGNGRGGTSEDAHVTESWAPSPESPSEGPSPRAWIDPDTGPGEVL